MIIFYMLELILYFYFVSFLKCFFWMIFHLWQLNYIIHQSYHLEIHQFLIFYLSNYAFVEKFTLNVKFQNFVQNHCLNIVIKSLKFDHKARFSQKKVFNLKNHQFYRSIIYFQQLIQQHHSFWNLVISFKLLLETLNSMI